MEADFLECFDKNLSDKVDVQYVFQAIDAIPNNLQVPEERKKPWGTAHAVWMAEPVVDEPFAIVNADDYYGRKSLEVMYAQLQDMDKSKLEACLVGYQLENTLSPHGHVSRGICEVTPEGNLESIVERTNIYIGKDASVYYAENNTRTTLCGNEIVSMNLIGFSPTIFSTIEEGFMSFFESNYDKPKAEYYIPNVLGQVIRMGIKVPVLGTDDIWFGVTYKEDKPIARQKIAQLVAEKFYPVKLWN